MLPGAVGGGSCRPHILGGGVRLGGHSVHTQRCVHTPFLCCPAEFAREEIAELDGQLVEAETQLKLLLLPKDPLDERNVMLEIR